MRLLFVGGYYSGCSFYFYMNEALLCKTLGTLHQLCKYKGRNSATGMLSTHMHQLQMYKNVVACYGITRYYAIEQTTCMHVYARVCLVSRISTHMKRSRSLARLAMFSDESVEFQELLLDLPTCLLEKKPSLSLLFTKSSSRSEEGRGDQQMSPELLNKVISTNPHNTYLENTTRSLMVLHFHRINEVYGSQRGNRQTHKTTTVTLAHAPRVNKYGPVSKHNQHSRA